jgi:signal transduction histidine kinase
MSGWIPLVPLSVAAPFSLFPWLITVRAYPAGQSGRFVFNLAISLSVLAAGIFFSVLLSGWTERRIRELITEKDRLAFQENLKTQRLNSVAHELRTPLTSIVGFCQLTQNRLEKLRQNLGVYPVEKSEAAINQSLENIHIIMSEGYRLSAFVNNFLDLAKIESGHFEWKLANCHPAEIVEYALTSIYSLSDWKDLETVQDVEPDLPEIRCDRDRLIQVLINLLSNAVKFTDRGKIVCGARKSGEKVEFFVSDTGLGIAPADIPYIFEEFRQAGNASGRSVKGTGLGLPICERIVELHGGKMEVESEVGKGSTFRFRLPLDPPANSAGFRGHL